jgi:hypothetical protein
MNLKKVITVICLCFSGMGHSNPIYVWNKEIGCQKIPEGIEFFLNNLSGVCGIAEETKDLVLVMCKRGKDKSVIIAVKDVKGCGIIPKLEAEFRNKMGQ